MKTAQFLTTRTVFGICCLLLSAPVGAEQTVLLVDDKHVLYRSGTERVLQQPARSGANPVLAETKPWELAIGYCSVHRNHVTGRYQCWYQSYAGGRAKDPTRRVVVCYATSEDGVNWDKPDLGLFGFNAVKNTNIVLVGNGGRSVNYGASVIVDPHDPDADRRYKFAYWDFVDVNGEQSPGLCVAFSPDGVHWQKHKGAPLLRGAYGVPGPPPLTEDAGSKPKTRPAISDVIDVMYDPVRRRHVIYSKTWIDGPGGNRFWKRAVVRTESEDFVHWTAPTLVMVPGDDDSGQLHGAPVFFHRGVYFGLVQRLDFGGFDRGGAGNMPSELAISRDGIVWQRPFSHDPFLPVTGDAASFDSGCLWTNATPVFVNDEMRFYYGAYSRWNSDVENDPSGIGLATLPRDRFVAIQPTDGSGQVTIKPMPLHKARTLTVNADAQRGQIRVEILTAKGYRVPGFTRDDAVAITDDHLRHAVSWSDKSLADLPKGEHQLRLHLNNAKLFAVTLHD